LGKSETPSTPAKVVEAENLSLTFATADGPVYALSKVTLSVEEGEFVSFIGPSGCGLSPEEARLNRQYGYVFQAPALYPWRTVERNVRLPLEIMKYSRQQQEQRVARNIDLVNLKGFERKFPWQLSGGMQQRASIARALSFDPKLLLMDEPFGALDEIVRDGLNLQLIKLWRETGKTVLFVTHSIPEAVFLSTRIVVMSPRPGRIIDIIDCDFPPARSLDIRETKEFLGVAHRVRKGLRAGHSYDD
jgi:NitT/TauT family transport system ATP-binding protein